MQTVVSVCQRHGFSLARSREVIDGPETLGCQFAADNALNAKIYLVQGDITELEVDAVRCKDSGCWAWWTTIHLAVQRAYESHLALPGLALALPPGAAGFVRL